MIKLIREDGAAPAAELAWNCQTVGENSAFPRYRSKNSIAEEFAKTLKQPDGKLLGCFDGDNLQGVLCLYTAPEKHYAEAVAGMFAKDGAPAVYAQFMEYVKSAFPGWEIIFACPTENAAAIAALTEAGAEVYEASLTMKVSKPDFKPCQLGGVNRLGKDRFGDYADFHDTVYPDGYWTAARIRDTRDRWDINVCSENGRIVAGIYVSNCDREEAEIYGAAADLKHQGRGLEAKLISRACQDEFKAGKKLVSLFVDESAEQLIAAARRLGFAPADSYHSYRLAVQ